MGALCSTEKSSSVNFEPSNEFTHKSEISESEICEPVTTAELKCDNSGTFGCFTVLDQTSYINLLRFANDNTESIKVTNEYNEEVKFIDIVEWLNPDDPINGACKFIKPQLTDDQKKNLFINNITELNFEDSNKLYYTLNIKQETDSARLLGRIFKKDTDLFTNNTTYRPYNGASVFNIILPDYITFTYRKLSEYVVDNTVTPPKLTKYEYSMKMNTVVLIMNKKCNGDLRTLIYNGYKFNSTKMMNEITPFMARIHDFNVTHFDLKLENIFICNGRYTIGDYGSLRKGRIEFDKKDVATYMFPSYGFTQKPAETEEEKSERKAKMKEWLDISKKISNYFPSDYNLPSPDLKPDPYNLYYYMVTVPSYFKNEKNKFEHAKYVDRYALALSIIYALTNKKISTFDEQNIRDLLDYKKVKYFENKYFDLAIGGNNLTSKLSNLTLKPISIKKNLQKTKETIKYNGRKYVIYITKRNKKVIIVKNKKIYI